MANPEHLAKLKEGVEAWNQWRRDFPDVRPFLNGADLRGVDFRVLGPSFPRPSGKREISRESFYAK